MDSRKWTTTLAGLFLGNCVYRASYFVLSVMLLATCASAGSTAGDQNGAVSTTERSFWNTQNYLLGDWGWGTFSVGGERS
jgi:hypothetical protein